MSDPDALLSYSETLPILLDLMQQRVMVVIFAHDLEGKGQTPIAILRGDLERAEAEDLLNEGASAEHFPAGESTILVIRTDEGSSSVLLVLSERNFYGAQVDGEGRLGVYLGCAHILISPDDEAEGAL